MSRSRKVLLALAFLSGLMALVFYVGARVLAKPSVNDWLYGNEKRPDGFIKTLEFGPEREKWTVDILPYSGRKNSYAALHIYQDDDSTSPSKRVLYEWRPGDKSQVPGAEGFAGETRIWRGLIEGDQKEWENSPRSVAWLLVGSPELSPFSAYVVFANLDRDPDTEIFLHNDDQPNRYLRMYDLAIRPGNYWIDHRDGEFKLLRYRNPRAWLWQRTFSYCLAVNFGLASILFFVLFFALPWISDDGKFIRPREYVLLAAVCAVLIFLLYMEMRPWTLQSLILMLPFFLFGETAMFFIWGLTSRRKRRRRASPRINS